MMEGFIEYITANAARSILFGVGFILALVAWIMMIRSKSHFLLKILLLPIPLLPIIGALIAMWIFTIPPRQHKDLRASMNHYGRGGRFIGLAAADSPIAILEMKHRTDQSSSKRFSGEEKNNKGQATVFMAAV